jgi:hypothetical protein
LFKYTVKDNNKNKLNLLEYFNQIFLKNIDVWGLTMLYMVFLDHIQQVFENKKENEKEKENTDYSQFIQKIKYIIIHFLFETPTEVININKLATELQSLNGIIAKFDKPGQPNTSVNYFESLKKIDTSHIKEVGTKEVGTKEVGTKEVGGSINKSIKKRSLKKRSLKKRSLKKRKYNRNIY